MPKAEDMTHDHHRAEEIGSHADDLLRDLRALDPAVRASAVRAVPEMLADDLPASRALLQPLLDDPVPTVRTAVADALDDIARRDPELALAIAEEWAGSDPSDLRQQLLRHGLRSLRIAGDARALRLMNDYGYVPPTGPI